MKSWTTGALTTVQLVMDTLRRFNHAMFYFKNSVSMHNVPEEKVFRPDSWKSFGMDKEGADYRACQAYGPLYTSTR